MDAMSTLQLSQLRERAAQLLRKYRIPLLVFLLGVALALVPGKTKKTDAQQTTAASADTAFDLSATQKQLEALLSAIDGAGRVRLMLTLSSGEQIIYQTDSGTVDRLRQYDAETRRSSGSRAARKRNRRCSRPSIQRIRGRSSSVTARSAQASVLQSHRLYRASQGSEAIKSQW